MGGSRALSLRRRKRSSAINVARMRPRGRRFWPPGRRSSLQSHNIIEAASGVVDGQGSQLTMPNALPIIDLGSWGEGDGASLTGIAAEVGAACRDVGFFYVVNHGVAPELIAKT